MAKYDITYSCGHTVEKQLFGKNKDRESYIEWAKQGLCPDCWGKQKREEEQKKPITMTMALDAMATSKEGDPILEVSLTGGTINKKDEIKAMGYHWDEIRAGQGLLSAIFSSSSPQKGWIKRVAVAPETVESIIKGFFEEGKNLGASVQGFNDPMTFAIIVQRQKERKEKADKIAKIEKPQRPVSHPYSKFPDGKWNGKYYGSDKYGYSYYIDNVKYEISNEEYRELISYSEAISEYNKKVENVKNH